MKRSTIIILSLGFGLVVIGGWARAGLEGSKHDFSNEAWFDGDRCSACHVPEREEPAKVPPLWDTRADPTRRFGAAGAGRVVPGPGTLICIRCHDGTIAKDAVAGAVPRKRFANRQHEGLFGVGHGASDHPVGVDYPQFDKAFHPITTVIARGIVFLPNGKVECSSCHDPHNESGVEHMLVASNDRSRLCLACHKK